MAASDFKFDFKEEHIIELLRGNEEAEDWYDAMCEILPLWEIDTAERVAMFIAQCGHESNNFKVLSENLNYSADGLNKVFPKYFKNAGRDAQAYHRQPRKIANVIYANRMDNGNTESDDGWKFRGGGILQLTGRYNYTAFGKEVDKTPEEATEYVRTKKGALDSACWFWDTNDLNKYCDARDVKGATKRINGGYIGLEDRQKHYQHAMEVLGGHWSPSKVVYETVKLGSRGPTVKAVQEELEIGADGVFGPGTEAHVKKWQEKHGLTPDGVMGPKSLAIMFGED